MNQIKVKNLFDYVDGKLFWKVSPAHNVKIGDAAGSLRFNGYWHTQINGKRYFNHRIIFLWHHGYLPTTDIDHIDGNRVNNKVENLRPATGFENARNAKVRADNTSGAKGVSWVKHIRKWVVQLRVDKKIKRIGYFDDLELADLVAIMARDKYYGEFARHK
jgi:hypothetical protein